MIFVLYWPIQVLSHVILSIIMQGTLVLMLAYKHALWWFSCIYKGDCVTWEIYQDFISIFNTTYHLGVSQYHLLRSRSCYYSSIYHFIFCNSMLD